MTNKTINGARRMVFSDGIEAAAKLIEKRMDDYVNEHGSEDPETGSIEFPGNGDEYVGELMEIVDELRALLAAPDPIVEADGIGEPVAWMLKPIGQYGRALVMLAGNTTFDEAKEIAGQHFEVVHLYSADQLAALQSTIAHLRQHKNDYMEASEETRKALTAEIAQLKAENERLRGDKARIDFWQDHPQYIGGFSPSGNWSFFNRGSKTCYGEDLRDALDQMQTMDAELEVRRMNP